TYSAAKNELLIIEAGLKQHIIATNATSGQRNWVLGREGGYRLDPYVYDDKFYFSDSVTGLSQPFIATQTDGSFWVGDPGNERVLHFSEERQLLNSIYCLPHSYSVSTVKNLPEAVFNQYLEFRVDYNKPLDKSWRLHRNWRAYIKPDYHRSDMLGIFRQATLFENGNIYALLDRIDEDRKYTEIVELPTAGSLKYTGINLGEFAVVTILSNGDLVQTITNREIGDSGYVLR